MTTTLLALLLAVAEPNWVTEPVRHVDPFIGTGAHGHTYPGATLPFGMVQLSPDTRLEGWDGCSGYHYSDTIVYGFSHTHLSGTGISDYGDILFMPLVGRPHFDNGYEGGVDNGYASRFDKSTERAEPGWYAVRLDDYGIDVELTATERTGLHRYRYPEGERGWLILDLAHRDPVTESGLRVVSPTEIEGFRRSSRWARDQIVHFVARFSKPFVKVERDETDLRARFDFGDETGELLVRVGISAVDIDGARKNLDAELGERGFDEVRQAATASWNEALGKVTVAGGTDEQQTIFYTALYHAMVAPNVYSDVDGRYLGMDRKIHRAEGRRHYTVFSLWDTFRSAHPLYVLLEPDRTREFLQTFLAMYEQGGRLPVWELAANETDTMIGYHAIPVIVDAWVKGIRGFGAEMALAAMIDSAMRDHFGLEAYKRQGFIGVEDDGESVSKTLEYAYDDWCIARMASDLRAQNVAHEFALRSQAWRHLLDPETGFMRARRNQRWVTPFDPYRVDNHYTEANAWQYSFFVPHDVEGMIEAMGGEQRFVERLDAVFEASVETTGREQADITGLIGQYAHGNEPSHHMAWLYHYAGLPGKSAERVGQILDELYTARPDGLSGNEDCGQMSAWYVFAAAGLYPVVPGSDEYLIGAPVFDAVRWTLDDGATFVVRAPQASAAARYVKSATLNGKATQRSYLRHHEMLAGGELTLELAGEPGAGWGRAEEMRPNSKVDGTRVLAAPYVDSISDRFRDRLTVELVSAEPGAIVRYSLDGETWQPADGPLEIRESTRLRLYAERGEQRSTTVESYLHRIPNRWTVETAVEPHPQYTAGGTEALIDGLPGDPDWRTGGWVGFQHDDLSATVDMGELREVRRAGASFLQDQRSWIWMPVDVAVSTSVDGETFREVARMTTDVAEDAEGNIVRRYIEELEAPVEARYVKFEAANFGVCPAWHLGAGGGAYIFVDELLIE